MVGCSGKRILSFLIPAAGLLLSGAALPADSRITVDLDAVAAVSSGGGGIESGWLGTGVARGAVTLDQTDNPNVRSQLRVEAVMPSAAVAAAAAGVTGETPDPFESPYDVSISRAYVKFRFPALRSTVGKAPITWGEGRYYNAGNLPVSLTAAEANLVQQSFEDAALWQAGVYVPLGSFSFFETVWLPDETGLLLENSGGGTRLVLRPLGIKTELSYLFDGMGNEDCDFVWAHKAALGFQGNLGVDWHLTGRVSVPQGYDVSEALEKSLRISAGLYTLLAVGYDGTLNLRLEGLAAPFGRWEEADGGLSENDPFDAYGIELYPEVSFDFGNNLTAILRSVISPVDASAMIIPGAVWSVFQGFSLFSFLSVQTGDSSDVFSSEAPGALALQTGCRVTY
jgi:hypothetical protein